MVTRSEWGARPPKVKNVFLFLHTELFTVYLWEEKSNQETWNIETYCSSYRTVQKKEQPFLTTERMGENCRLWDVWLHFAFWTNQKICGQGSKGWIWILKTSVFPAIVSPCLWLGDGIFRMDFALGEDAHQAWLGIGVGLLLKIQPRAITDEYQSVTAEEYFLILQEITIMPTPVDLVFIHHTAMDTCDSLESCSEQMRIIQDFHMDDRGQYTISYFLELLFCRISVSCPPLWN